MKKLFPTYIGAQAEMMETVVVSDGKRGMQMELAPDDLLQVTAGNFADITE